jgi:hypothetical protein
MQQVRKLMRPGEKGWRRVGVTGKAGTYHLHSRHTTPCPRKHGGCCSRDITIPALLMNTCPAHRHLFYYRHLPCSWISALLRHLLLLRYPSCSQTPTLLTATCSTHRHIPCLWTPALLTDTSLADIPVLFTDTCPAHRCFAAHGLLPGSRVPAFLTTHDPNYWY